MRSLGYFIYLFLLTATLPGFSQPDLLPRKNVVFSKLPEDLGLSETSVNAILQDRDGFIWVGTWSGLIRYDGYTSKVFHSGSGEFDLASNLISSLFEDHEGNLWIGTHVSGLFRYDKKSERFSNYRHDESNPHSLSNNNIWKVIEDRRHNLWIATENGLNYFDRTSGAFSSIKNNVSDPGSLSDNFVSDVFLDSNDTLWVATNYGLNKLISIKGGKAQFKRYLNSSAEAAHNFVYQVVEVKGETQSEIWFITKKGVKRLDEGTIINYLPENKSPNHSLFRSMLTVGGKNPFVLLGSAVDLSLFNIKDRTFIKHIPYVDGIREGIQSMAATALFIDRAGVLWVGTKKGLYKYDTYGEDFELVLTSTFDPTNSIITGISQSSKGYWFSTIGGGLYHRDGNVFRPFRIPVSQKSDFAPFVQSLFVDNKKQVWLGTAGSGIIKFDGEDALRRGEIGKVTHYHLTSEKPISDDYIVSFAEGEHGSILAGTWNGVLVNISSDGAVTELRNSMFGGSPIIAMHTDNAGATWIGTRGNGAFRIRRMNDTPEIKHYMHKKNNPLSIGSNFINAIYEDHAGAMWFGTESGLTLFARRTESFTPYEINEGPANKVIVGLLEDDAGKLWCSHWNGITVIDPSDSTRLSTRTFDRHDLIQGGFFYNNVCLKDDKGNLLFGGSNGFNIIHPGKMNSNNLQPKVVISDFRIGNQSVLPGVNVNGRVVFREPVYSADKVELEYMENNILFEFAALDFAAPEKIQYAYLLEGFEKQWNYTTAERRVANYTNLPHGKYIFRVKATNNDGVWNSDEKTFVMIIHPPWWKTTYAFLAYACTVLILLIAFRKLILMRANYRHDIRLERFRSDNMEKLNKAKLQFFTNISHEFRTPLTLILGPVQNLIDSGIDGKFARDQLHIIHNNAQRLLRLINQLLDFRKAESGNLKIQAREGNLVKFVKEIKLSFDGLAEKMKVTFTFQSSSNVIKVYFDADHFEKILFNLLSNAFKHTPEGGAVSITIIENQNAVILSVTNTGKGIRTEHFNKIFQAFFSYDEEQHQVGTGLGLALVKSLTEAHHAELTVESIEHDRTSFSVQLQLGHEHFKTDELGLNNGDPELIYSYQALESLSREYFPISNDKQIEAPLPLEDRAKILIVEDNTEVRTYIRTLFSNRYIILEAENGKEGMSLALEEIPDIIISDVMMPILDGISLCKQLKVNLKTSHIPVILLTARTSLIFKVEGLETGADDYVVKPFNPKVLQLKVRNLLRTQDSLRKIFQDNRVIQIEPKHVTLNSSDEKFLQKVMESVESNLGNTAYSVEDLGENIGMSRMQLYRKLKALTGQSANEFIRTMRLKRAAQLLKQKQLTIAEITYSVGFNDLQYFREAFKKFFGVTPSDYAEK